MKQTLSSKIRERYKKLPETFTITHHAGAFKKKNSLESIKYSLEYGADIIEVDISFTRHLVPVLKHNKISKNNDAVLFEEAVKIVSADSKCKMNLDLKSVANLEEIDKIIKKYNMVSRVFYTGVTEKWVATVKKKSIIPFYLNFKINSLNYYKKNNAEALAKKIKKLGAIGYNVEHTNASKKLCSAIKNEGLLLSIYTVNDSKEIQRVLTLYPDNITTKRIDLFEKLTNNKYSLEMFYSVSFIPKVFFLFLWFLILRVGIGIQFLTKKKVCKLAFKNNKK